MRPLAKKKSRNTASKGLFRKVKKPGDDRPLSKRSLIVRRFFHRAEARVETLPPFCASLASAAFVGTFALYGLVLNGSLYQGLNNATANMGFEIKRIAISGHENIGQQAVLNLLGISDGLSLLTFNVAAARSTLLNESWIKTVSIRKIYPDKLSISLQERTPFAIWQRGGSHSRQVSVIASDGSELGPYDPVKHSNLPTLVGYGSQDHGARFLALLDEFPELKSRVWASIFQSQRRWDLLLANEVLVKLPEGREREAIATLMEIDRKNAILSKDIASVDMRLADRLVMRLSDEAMINRLATLKSRKKAKTKGENI